MRAAIRATPGHLHSLLDQAVMSWLKRGERVVHSRQATGTMPSYCAVPTAAGHIGGGAGTRIGRQDRVCLDGGERGVGPQ